MSILKKCLTVFSSHIGIQSIGIIIETFMCILCRMKEMSNYVTLQFHHSLCPWKPGLLICKKGDIDVR